MFREFSKAGAGVIILIISFLINLSGIEVPEGSIEEIVFAIYEVVGFILLVVGQLDRKDLKLGLIRR